jgi:glycosyltransferase involved in cell wall biosynthesis
LSRPDPQPVVALSVVIPVYNSGPIFPELYRRLCTVLEKNSPSFEVITVLDGCTDNSLPVISSLAAGDGRLKVIEFSRNFGHQAAVTAGLHHAAGGTIIIMDDDLEDPPEVLPAFIARINEGFDVVYGIRKKRKRSLIMRLLFSTFYRLSGKLFDIAIPRDSGDFCIMTRRVLQVLLAMPENNRYLRGMRAWAGFNQTGIEYEREERFSGASGYTLRKYFSLAFDGIFSFSFRPLKYVTLMGIFIALLSFAYAALIVYLKLTGHIPDVPGWTFLTVAVLLLSGIQLIAMGVIGEYISRIYDEVKHRPPYVIRTRIGFSAGADHE